jgi:hypothetical protein
MPTAYKGRGDIFADARPLGHPFHQMVTGSLGLFSAAIFLLDGPHQN